MQKRTISLFLLSTPLSTLAFGTKDFKDDFDKEEKEYTSSKNSTDLWKALIKSRGTVFKGRVFVHVEKKYTS